MKKNITAFAVLFAVCFLCALLFGCIKEDTASSASTASAAASSDTSEKSHTNSNVLSFAESGTGQQDSSSAPASSTSSKSDSGKSQTESDPGKTPQPGSAASYNEDGELEISIDDLL